MFMAVFSEYIEKLEKMQSWIIGDLTRSSTEAHANFLVAMGLFNYIEMLGGFYYWNDSESGKSSKRFGFVFNNLFSDKYKRIIKHLNVLTGNSYDCLRNGLTHEYLIKTYRGSVAMKFTIYGPSNAMQFTSNVLEKDCGIELERFDNFYHLRIYNPRLISDLNRAFQKYRILLIGDKAGYKSRFLHRCRNIHFEEFN